MKIPFLPRLSHEFKRDAAAMAKILAPPVFVVFMAFFFRAFVARAIMANVYINIGIICTAAYGVALILARLVAAQGDFLVIERFGREALSGAPMEDLLEEPWLKRKYVRHYLAHIAQTGGTISSQLDQNAIENELHALSGEYGSRLELPQFLVGLMIAMGLLGTFIGLLTTLTGVAGMLDELGGGGGDIQSQFAKLVTDLRIPLAGMGIAFSASMFGLICSLMLSVMMTNLRRYINRVMALARNVMHDLVKLSRPSAVSAVPFAEGGRPSSGGSEREMALVASRIDLLIKKMELLIQSVDQSSAGQQRLNDLLGFGPRMKETAERTLEEIKALGLGNAAQQQLTQRLIDAQAESGRLLAATLDTQRLTKETGDKHLESIRALAAQQSDHGRLFQKFIDMNREAAMLLSGIMDAQRQAKETGERNAEGLRVLAAGQDGHAKLLQHIADLDADTLHMMEAALDMHRQHGALQDQALGEMRSLVAIQNEQRQIGQVSVQGLEQIARTADASANTGKALSAELLSSVRTLADRLGNLEEVQIGESRHLFAIKESLTRLSQNLSVVDLVSTGIGQQTLLLESLVGEAKNSQNTLFAIQQDLCQGGSRKREPGAERLM